MGLPSIAPERRRPHPAVRSQLAALVVSLVVLAMAGVIIVRLESAPSYVTRTGTTFTVGGKPFRFVGFNLYNAAATYRYSCTAVDQLTNEQLGEALQYMHRQAGATVVRFVAYQTYTAAGTDWTGVDRVISAARRADMRVLPVLEDGPGHCTTGSDGEAKWEYQDDSWYQHGYRIPYGNAALSYRDYVTRIVTHYRDNPTILGWMMMNEAETMARDEGGSSALVNFAGDIGGLIKSIDHHHLVTVGTQSNGAPGASGADFTAVYGVPSVDFAEVHDYASHGSDTDPLPGSNNGVLPSPTESRCLPVNAPLACSFSIADTVLHKPLIVGEAGIMATDAATRSRRAQLFATKVRAAFDVGASGYLVWQFTTVNSDMYGVLPSSDDPLFGVLKQIAEHRFS